MAITAKKLKEKLKALGNSALAHHSQRFFKTGKGEYGEGDRFIGIKVPVLRKLANKHSDISLDEVLKLLKSPVHEERQLSLFILVQIFKKGSEEERKNVTRAYLDNTQHINNWDLVDCSAHYIVGEFLYDKDRQLLYKLAQSKSLWERRIAIMSTFYFIKKNEFDDALNISEILLHDKEDLIQKAVGWMLREIGKRNRGTEEKFLKKHYKHMPRTMLRYAIEKFPENRRQMYLKGTI
ncbi:MAG: DNA alkylation repair protein [Candidatus Aminicenantaceae bacterium]